MSSNCVWLQIIFRFLRSLLRENGSFPKIFIKKQTRWLNDNSYWIRLSQNILICHCLADQLFASADLLLATDKSQYFARPRPIFVHYFGNFCRQGIKSWKSWPSFFKFQSMSITCHPLQQTDRRHFNKNTWIYYFNIETGLFFWDSIDMK